jgi:hypothetical protein
MLHFNPVEKHPMKSLLAVVALSIAAAVTAPAFAQTKPPAPTQVDCQKMKDKKWDEGSKTCLPK